MWRVVVLDGENGPMGQMSRGKEMSGAVVIGAVVRGDCPNFRSKYHMAKGHRYAM